jgi:hypothetical protein
MTDSDVAKLYTNFPYPRAEPDLSEDGVGVCDPSLSSLIYWPEGRSRKLKILIAGCGTRQAAMYAIRNPDCRVTGVDVSRPILGSRI